jgi:TolB-like protein/Flp pilus assembly protein TadD
MATDGDDEEASGSTPTVFISYASLDSAIAETVCEALEKARVTCWIAPRDVTAGAPYAGQIIHAIDAATASVLILSRNAAASPHVLREVERTASKRHSIVALRIDQAPLPADFEYFLNSSHWLDTSSSDIERTLPKLVSAVQVAIQAPAMAPTPVPAAHASHPTESARPAQRIALIAVTVIGVGLAVLAVDRLWMGRQNIATMPAPAPATAAFSSTTFNPPPHSIAVLPFVNMSGDKAQDYFSDGLSEELLNDLARINQLQVAARTSAFSFKGKDTDIGSIARKLNVGAVLEGSVRRSTHTVRVTAQLINAVTGFHMWSQTYDRNLGDVLKLQSEVAEAVANALKVTLLGDAASKIELGGTRNAEAFDAYLRAEKAFYAYRDEKDAKAAIATYAEAIDLDPHFALGYAARSLALSDFARNFATGPAFRETLDRAQADAGKAVALSPELAEAHLALAFVYQTSLNFAPANQEFQRALSLAPGNARVLRVYGRFAVLVGEGDAGLTTLRRAVALDPLNSTVHNTLGASLYWLRRYDESITVFANAHALDPRDPDPQTNAGFAYYMLGNFQGAVSSCEISPKTSDAYFCLALVYNKLGRHADAQAMLTKLRAGLGDDGAYEYTSIYAQWGYTAQALEWLETAMRLHRPWLERMKATPLLDPLRHEPRFQAVERELKFPA